MTRLTQIDVIAFAYVMWQMTWQKRPIRIALQSRVLLKVKLEKIVENPGAVTTSARLSAARIFCDYHVNRRFCTCI